MEYPRVEVVDQGRTALLIRVLTETSANNGGWSRHFLVGQDSSVMGQPFITQVAKSIVTVEEAFRSLVPLAVKEARARGLEVKRQGDWFFIPSPPPQGPSCHIRFLETQERIYQERRHFQAGLPLHPPEFQYGALYGDSFWEPPTRHMVWPWHTRDIPEGTQVVYRSNGHHYVRGVVEAPDHEPLCLEDWHTAHRANSGPWGRQPRRQGD